MRTAIALAAAVTLALALACGGGDGDSGTVEPATPTVVITNSEGERAELTVEFARSAAERSRGLMFREALAEDAGMLFVFPQDTGTGFWMKDTLIPLSIAFIAADGTILDIQDMEPLSKQLHYAPEAYRYALEVNQGWFERHGLGIGDAVEIPEGAGEE